MNPLDGYGPDFLALYVTLLVLTVVGLAVARRRLGGPRDARPGVLDGLSPAVIAWLRDGDGAAAETLILADQPITGAPPALPAAGPRRDDAAARVRAELRRARRTLETRGLVPRADDERLYRWLAALPGALAGFGLAKVALGLVRDRPVGWLVLLVGVTGVVAGVTLVGLPRVTRRAEAAVADLVRSHAALRATAWVAPGALSGGDAALAAALFGGLAVGGGLRPPAERARAEAAASTGSGSSCSAGDVDAGGDGGGDGGCGGCGGGD